MPPRWRSRRAPPRRFRERSRRRKFARWTRWSSGVAPSGRTAPASSRATSPPTSRPRSIRRPRASSTAACSTTGRSTRRSPRSTAARPTARSTAASSTSIPIPRPRPRRVVARLIAEMRDAPPRSPLARLIAEVIDAWATHAGLVYSERDDDAARRAAAPSIPDWASFLLAFDVDYRKRRLNFLIEGQNRLYQMIEHPRFKGLDPAVIDALKRDFYGCLELVQRREDMRFFDADTRALAAELFAVAPSAADARDLRRRARHFVEANAERVGALIARLAARIELNASTRDLDVLLAGLDAARWPAEARR